MPNSQGTTLIRFLRGIFGISGVFKSPVWSWKLVKPLQINFSYKTGKVELLQPISGCLKAFLAFYWPWNSVFRSFFDFFWRFWMNFKGWYPTIQTLFPLKIAMTSRSSKVLSHCKIWGFENGSKFADVSKTILTAIWLFLCIFPIKVVPWELWAKNQKKFFDAKRQNKCFTLCFTL